MTSWVDALPPLVGTVIGGAITIVGQRLTDKRRDEAGARSEKRQIIRDQIERQRTAVVTLHAQVAADVAGIRARITSTDAATNAERLELLESLPSDIRAQWDRATSMIAPILDRETRKAADNVYESWGLWVASEIDALANDTEHPDSSNAMKSPGRLAVAVRLYLTDLSEQEAR